MKKEDFKQDTRYTISAKDENGKVRPMNVYVMRLHGDGMIVRMTDKDGRLTKLAYDDVIKVVAEKEVPEQNRYYIPDAVLAEANWKDRKTLDHYSSSPHMGK
ncbi:MAG: hypothetical protein R3240_12725 [Gammaproteobacteria bacterium]|nr:hypothetical protein [Gammaproteobacteria bacterium]